MITCAKCGTNNKSGSKYCKTCGRELEQTKISTTNGKPSKTKECPHCKKLNYQHAVFCQFCGKEFIQGGSVPSDAAYLKFEESCKLQQKQLEQAKVKFQQSQARYECPQVTHWDDEQIAALYETYSHNHSALTFFLKEAESLSDALEKNRLACHQQLLQSSDSDSKLKEQRIVLFSDRAEKYKSSFYQTTKDIVKAFSKEVPEFRTGSQLSTPLQLWNQKFTQKLLQQHLFVGTSVRHFNIFGHSLDLPRLEYIRLINKNNLIVKYNDPSKELCMNFVSTLLGRMIWTTGGLGLKVDVIDTKDWTGVSSQLNDSELCWLTTKKADVDSLLLRLLEDEMNVITTTLNIAHFTSVADYNASNNNKLGTQVLVVKDLNDCASKTDLSLLPQLMEKAANAGLCVILLVNEDTPKRESSTYRKTSEDPLTSVEKHALTINLIGKTLCDNDPYDELLFDLMDEKQLAAIIPNSMVNEPTGACSSDFMPEKSQDFWKKDGANEICLTIGIDNYSPKVLRLNDNPYNSLVMVTGSISSKINPWLDSLVLEALTNYDPSTVSLLLVDCYGEDSTLFDKYNPITSMNNMPITILKVDGFDNTAWRKISSHKETDPRLLAFIVGGYEKHLKDYVDKCRPLYSKGNLKGVDIICVDGKRDAWDPNKIDGWNGLKIAFGPSTMYADTIRRDQLSLDSDEFFFDGVKNIALLTDEFSADSFVDILAEKLREKFTQREKPEPVPDPHIEEGDDSNQDDGAKDFPEDNQENKRQIQGGQPPVEPLQLEEVSYKTNFPLPIPNVLWAGDAREAMTIPIGIHINSNGKAKTKSLCFDDSKTNCNAAFVIGGSGSGKTSLINALIVSAAYRYSPDNLNMYLIDFSGVEFQHYEKFKLPHAKLIATGADREFGLSVLKEVELEMNRRINHPEITDYPRILLVLDECHRFFVNESRSNSISAQATAIIDNIIRQGRKFRINIIMATQNLTGIPSELHQSVDFRLVGKPTRNDFSKWMTGKDSDYNIISSYDHGEFTFIEKGVCDADIEEQHIKSFFVKSGKMNEKHELDELVERLHIYAEQYPELCQTVKVGLRSFRGTAIVEFSPNRMSEQTKVKEDKPTSMYFYLGESVEGKDDIAIQIKTGQDFQNILVAGGTDIIDGESVVVNGLMSISQSYELVEVETDEVEEEVDETDETLDIPIDDIEEDEELEEFSDDQIEDISFEPNAVNYVFNFNDNDPILATEINRRLISPFSSKSKVIENDEEAVFETLTKVNDIISEREKNKNYYPHVYLTFLEFGNGRMFRPTSSYGDSKCTQLMNKIMKQGSRCGIFVILQSQVLKDFPFLTSKYIKELYYHVVALQMQNAKAESLALPNASSLNSPGSHSSGKCRGLYQDVNSENVQKFKPYKFINEQ